LLDPPGYNSGGAIRAFLLERGMGIRKKWGQHFLVNARARSVLADALEIKAGDGVFEIGPGIGAMTSLLLEKGARVRAFEIDPGFSSILKDLFPAESFTLVPGDVLKTWEENDDGSPFLLGNLPYTIAAVLVGNLIEKGRLFRRMAITVQKEVAFRMMARPGCRDYSSISVLCASVYDIKLLMTLKAASFYPPPRVDSAALLFTPRNGKGNEEGNSEGNEERKQEGNSEGNGSGNRPMFAPLVRALFAARRKTAANNLEHFLAFSGILHSGGPRSRFRDAAETLLLQCGISPKERAENLDYGSFNALADALEKYRKGQ
jgi:16S rRNA (adenine1518-N6/adenine1519-N6)-dimethyltransferase